MTAPISNKRGETNVVPAGMQWDASEYADKDGLESDESGTVYFADARNDAWHQLGTQFGRAMTAEELMRESHLGNWDVRKVPAEVTLIQEDGVERVEIPGKFAMIRTNPSTGRNEPLPGAVVGNFYTPIQNETACDMLQYITDETGAIFETAGSLQSGRNVFVTMKLPRTMKIGGVDEIDLNIAWMNRHDGTGSQLTIVTPTRVVCQNTQRAAIKGAVSEYKITHTKSSEGRIADARTALRLSFNYLDAFEAEAEKMINAQMTKDQFVRITRGIWAKPTKDEAEEATRKANSHAKREAELVELFTVSATNENIRGTAWAGYQAITEYLDHFQPVQSTKFGGNPASARATRTIMGRGDDDKLNAWNRTLAFASR